MLKNVDFKYVDYGKNILNSIIRKEKKSEIIVFSNYNLKKAYLQTLQKELSILDLRPTLLEYDEFIKKLFPTDKVILKEITKLITLYSIFPKDLKEKNRIKNYNDFVNYGTEFFSFFSNKLNYLVEKFQDLQPWQEDKIQDFERLKKIYNSYLNEKNFIPAQWEKEIGSMDLSLFKMVDKLIFVDIMEFSSLEKEIIKKISENTPIEIILQCHSGDFDEADFKLKELSFPKELKSIDIYKVSEDLEVAINIMKSISIENNLKEGYSNIYSPDLSQNRLNKILPRQIASNLKGSLEETDIYLFLQGQYEILSSIEMQLDSAISLASIEKQINISTFRKNYNISDKDVKDFYSILDDDFKYFSLKLLESSSYERYKEMNISRVLYKIYQDISVIRGFTEVKDFSEFFKKNYTNFDMIPLENPSVLDAILFAMSISENADKIDPNIKLKNIFLNDSASGIFRVILDEMKGLDITLLKPQESDIKGYTRDFRDFNNQFSGKIYICDADSEMLPGRLGENSIFTEAQKQSNGLKTKEDERLIEKYRFFRVIFSDNLCDIYYKEDENRGIKISPFLEEIVLDKGLEIKTPAITLRECLSIFKNSIESSMDMKTINSESTKNWRITDYAKGREGIKSGFLFSKVIEDINLSPYSVINFQNCEFRYYLENVVGISKEIDSFEKNISAKFLGNFSHIVFEKIARHYERRVVENSDFTIEESVIEDIFNDVFRENRYKIPLHLDNYFKTIILKNLKEAAFKFYGEMEKMYKGEKILRFLPEKQLDKYTVFKKYSDFKVKLFGRSDLIIETENRKGIVDYKTGKKNEVQLDYYSILFFGDESSAEKFNFNIYKKQLEKSVGKGKEGDKTPYLTKGQLEEYIELYIKNENYTLAEKKAFCIYCEFSEICKREGN